MEAYSILFAVESSFPVFLGGDLFHVANSPKFVTSHPFRRHIRYVLSIIVHDIHHIDVYMYYMHDIYNIYNQIQDVSIYL